MIDIDNLIPFDRDDAMYKHVAVLGTTGSGKTNTGYVWAEEELRAGGTLTIVDPEGDYHFLKNNFDVLIIGCARLGNPIDLPITVADAGQAADLLADRNISVILDVSGFPLRDQNAFVLAYIGATWARYQQANLLPRRLVIDEVQLFAPEGPNTESKELIRDIAQRGRKRRLTLLVATQRPQAVYKAVLDLTDIRFLHRVARGRTLKAYDDLLPGSLPDAKNIVPGLARGQAIFMRGDDAQIIQVRPSDTFRPGQEVQPSARPSSVDANLLAELKRLLTASSATPAATNANRDPEIADLRSRLDAATKENALLRAQLADARKVAPLADQPPRVADQLPLMPIVDEPVRSSLATGRAMAHQRRCFETLLKDLAKLRKHDQRILAFLIQHEDQSFTARDLARWVGLSESTITSHPPIDLLRLGVASRADKSARSGRDRLYSSLAYAKFARDFPDLEPDDLRDQIVKRCE